ncbi:hypothetical protein [Sporomusa acidovorans]|uniref:Uncharacterized protein n=1 Tax=Sporomusa acidovorans (strain ATCC 49682 / DSM 3132 / Mol) TaxID=1123286 RepID=A0ABZ3J989_SPOA4|nr:hypothetical protein [Sporomusa acidovorans]OZC16028.1 hypothetical protein SPACI_43940 [Sporomusa acidovorans DSM 3132]SDD89227.1 hypothetical protein SAMN04488499_1005103 [Sporomusa acidovorans]
MKFFLPAAENNDQTQSVYNQIKQFAQETTSWPIRETRIFSIQFRNDGKEYYAEVGKVENLTGDLVIAIFESELTYLICTKYRGVLKDMPIIVGKKDTITHTLFEKE